LNRIKCVIGNARGFGYHGYFVRFYYDEGGKTYVAKPVKLEFEELPESMHSEPTLFIDKLSMDDFANDSDTKYKDMLTQKDLDKNEHIANINQILDKVLFNKKALND